ncbi:MAG: GTP-binding protein [Candidatus Asgardarchaeia archaeon]
MEIQFNIREEKDYSRFPIIIYRIHGNPEHTLIVFIDEKFQIIDKMVSAEPITPINAKIIFIGDAGVGKTSIIHRHTIQEFSTSYLPTIGVDMSSDIVVADGTPVNLIIWDFAGQTLFEPVRRQYYAGAYYAILVYDITNTQSFKNIMKKWWIDLNTYTSNCGAILVGNKVDLGLQRQIPTEKGMHLAEELGIDFIETSAKINYNIKELFQLIAENIVKGYKNNNE